MIVDSVFGTLAFFFVVVLGVGSAGYQGCDVVLRNCVFEAYFTLNGWVCYCGGQGVALCLDVGV